MRERADLLGRFQRRLLDEGVPLAWLVDVGIEAPLFAGSQWLFMRGALDASGDLNFHAQAPISAEQWRRAGGTGTAPGTRGEAAAALGSDRRTR